MLLLSTSAVCLFLHNRTYFLMNIPKNNYTVLCLSFRSILPWQSRCRFNNYSLLGRTSAWGKKWNKPYLLITNAVYCYRVFADSNDLYASAFLQQRPNDYGIPVAVEVTYVQDNFLTSDVLNEMVVRRHRYIIPERCQTCYQNVFVCLFVFVCRCCWLITTGERLTSSSSASTGVLTRPCWTRSK